MEFSLKILESDQVISQEILKALLPEISQYMQKGIRIVKNELPTLIKYAISESPEYKSILSGELKYEFGIPDSAQKLAGLLDTWGSNIQYIYSPPKISGSLIKSSFSANMIRVDFADVLYTDYALVIDGLRGYTLPWLEWLLLEGNRTIVKNYEVSIQPHKNSRTGNAIMKQSAGSWKVPSAFSGTVSDNWITRVLDGVQPEIEFLVERAFSP